MTNEGLQMLPQIEELAAKVTAECVNGDPKDADQTELACEEYQEECNPERLIYRIRQVIDRVHDDDSACENPFMNAVEAVVYHALEGSAQTMGIKTD